MRSFRKQMKFHWIDFRKAIYIFWLVLTLVNSTQIVIQHFWPGIIDSPIDQVFAANYSVIAIFTLVAGLITATQTFPLMMSFGFTRKQFFTNVQIISVIYCAGMALMQSIVVHAGSAIIHLFDSQSQSSLIPFFTLWYMQFWIYLAISFLFFVMGIVFYRFGTLAGIFVIAVYIMLLYWITEKPSFDSYFNSITANTSPTLILIPLIITIIAASIGWLLCRRVAIRTH